jgi:hypothetical protein
VPARSWRYARAVPTKKQRRRQQKLRRHEYEDVWVDADGNVVDVEGDDDYDADGAVTETRSNGAGKSRPATSKARTGVRSSSGKVVQPPSWGRVLKRGLFFAPIMFILITILPGSDRFSSSQKVLLTVQYMLMLVVFMYLTERVTYRIWRRRQGGTQPQKR